MRRTFLDEGRISLSFGIGIGIGGCGKWMFGNEKNLGGFWKGQDLVFSEVLFN